MSTDNRFSEDAFYQFIDFVGKKGLVKESKARNWKGAVTQLLSILDENEKEDLRDLDIDSVIERYSNIKNTAVTSSSLKIYRSRFRGAYNDFISWAQDPVNYKPSGKTLTTTKSDNKAKKPQSSESKQGASKHAQIHAIEQKPVSTHPDSVVFPIPISGGRIITINNLPHELSRSDAEKISAVVKALAVSEPKE